MRPIEKWAVGTHGVQAEYNPYQSAKQKLSENQGDYCCYCDRRLDVIALEVEHLKPKKKFPAQEFKWDNFLLACKSCNIVKDDKDLLGAILFPHTHDTFYAFSISPSAFVIPRNGLQPADNALAEKTIRELGLNRKEGDPDRTPGDDRFKYRRQALDVAMRYLQKLETGKADVETIVDLALSRGFWLVWMEVFANHLDVQQKLANAFQGTYPKWANQSL
jgi:uncharacterized protein (TIGR02646 family)